jgi:hypothetical protein
MLRNVNIDSICYMTMGVMFNNSRIVFVILLNHGVQ